MDWPKFRRVERQARRLHEVMERLDVDPGALVRLRHGEAYAEARTRCLFCGTGGKCLRYLDGPRPANRPEFCPNLSIFEACKRTDQTWAVEAWLSGIHLLPAMGFKSSAAGELSCAIPRVGDKSSCVSRRHTASTAFSSNK